MDSLFDNFDLNQLPIVNRDNVTPKRPPLVYVDYLADELVKEYGTPDYRKWYCALIYRYGLAQVEEWRKRAEKANAPVRVFSKYAAQAKNTKKRYQGNDG